MKAILRDALSGDQNVQRPLQRPCCAVELGRRILGFSKEALAISEDNEPQCSEVLRNIARGFLIRLEVGTHSGVDSLLFHETLTKERF